MAKTSFPLLLTVWAVAFYACTGVTLAFLGAPGPLSREYLPLWAGTLVLGLSVVLTSRLICPRLGKLPASLAGVALGAIGSAAGGWVWSQFANEKSFLVPGLFWALGLFVAIPSGIAGGLIGFLQGRPKSLRVP